ncbi:hypothetical protein BDZ45DRAFT_785422 [Acephala macrosclerotiorum]|nr:hypothetical protein BDZ45DRAFT_785422 [Acephala macrosclerotiorum]
MPPFGLSSIFAASSEALLNARHLNTTSPVTVSDYLVAQWENPSEIIAILLLWGPETIQGAVAALAGRRITPARRIKFMTVKLTLLCQFRLQKQPFLPIKMRLYLHLYQYTRSQLLPSSQSPY